MTTLKAIWSWFTATRYRWIPALCVIVAVLAWAWGKMH